MTFQSSVLASCSINLNFKGKQDSVGHVETGTNTATILPLRKLAHAISRDFFSCKKTEKFIGKKNDVFNIFAQNIDC